jgi:transcription elongation GreA/GreB family factor
MARGTLDQRARRRYRRAVSKAFTREDDLTPDVVVPPRAKAPPPQTPPVEQLREEGKARLGARVKLADEDGHETEYHLVTPDDADPTHGSVSVESPLGRALLGKSAGDDIVVERPRGAAEYSVVSVWFDARQ